MGAEHVYKPLDDKHQIKIKKAQQSVTIDGLVKSDEPLVLEESGTLADGSLKNYPAVYYIDRKDVDFGKLERSDTSTYCPYKGHATYYSIKNGRADVAWSYEDAYDQVKEIEGHLAFYPDKVAIVAQ